MEKNQLSIFFAQPLYMKPQYLHFLRSIYQNLLNYEADNLFLEIGEIFPYNLI